MGVGENKGGRVSAENYVVKLDALGWNGAAKSEVVFTQEFREIMKENK
jgi:hypothetical protein